VNDFPTWQRWAELGAALASAVAAAVAAIYAARTVRDFRLHSELTALQDARKAALEAKEYAQRVTEGFPVPEWHETPSITRWVPLAGRISLLVLPLRTRPILPRLPRWGGRWSPN
jgi:hypothetical protein